MPVYTYTTLDDPSGATSAYGINNTQIVGSYSGTGLHGFVYSGGIFTTLDDSLGTRGTAAFGINGSGQVVGEYIDGSNNFHGFVENADNFTTLNEPQAVGETVAYGINDKGQIVGCYIDSTAARHGFLYNGNSYTVLNDPSGVNFTIARGINNSGQIVGYYNEANGKTNGFLYDGTAYTTIFDPLAVANLIAFGTIPVVCRAALAFGSSRPPPHRRGSGGTAHSMRASAQVTAPGAIASKIVAASTKPNRQNKSTCSRISVPLVQKRKLRLVNRKNRRARLSHCPRHDR